MSRAGVARTISSVWFIGVHQNSSHPPASDVTGIGIFSSSNDYTACDRHCRVVSRNFMGTPHPAFVSEIPLVLRVLIRPQTNRQILGHESIVALARAIKGLKAAS